MNERRSDQAIKVSSPAVASAERLLDQRDFGIAEDQTQMRAGRAEDDRRRVTIRAHLRPLASPRFRGEDPQRGAAELRLPLSACVAPETPNVEGNDNRG